MIELLWNLGHTVTKSDSYGSKYLLLAIRYDNYRLIYLDDIIKNKDLLEGKVPKWVLSFISNEGKCLMIGNLIKGHCISILFRSLTNKSFIDYGTTKGIFYGLGSLKDFTYGKPLIIVEGAADRDTLALLYPNVLATKSSSLSLLQIEILSKLTNKVILLLDNDQAGRDGTKLARKRLKEMNIRTYVMYHPRGSKDIGTILDKYVEGNYTEYKRLLTDYKLILHGALGVV